MLRQTVRSAKQLPRWLSAASSITPQGPIKEIRSLLGPSHQSMSSVPRSTACELAVVCRWSSGLMTLKDVSTKKLQRNSRSKSWVSQDTQRQWRRAQQALPIRFNVRMATAVMQEQQRKRALAALTAPGGADQGVPQALMLSSAVAGGAWIVAFGASCGVTFDAVMLQRMVQNIPMCFTIIGASDLAAQLMSGARPRSSLSNAQRSGKAPAPPILNLKQSAEVGAVGVGITGFGTVLWLDCLHLLIPAADCGLHSGMAIGALAFKAFLDSAVWGTVANTFSIAVRRVARGDSPRDVHRFWKKNILEVMKSDFTFWPAWAAMTFTLVPPEMQIGSYAIGNVFWNVYLSLFCRKTLPPSRSLQSAGPSVKTDGAHTPLKDQAI